MSVNILYIALGGAIGAVGRYAVVNFIGSFGHGFPFGTLAVNIVGSAVLGAVVEASALAWSPSPEIRAMIVVGMLGAFTTFSTFSLDAVTLMTRGEAALAMVYIAVSVILSIAAFWGGLYLTRVVLA